MNYCKTKTKRNRCENMFICFSSGDRYTVVKSCLYHLKNYGVDVWYDYHELILGDKKREKNFNYAIKSNDYFIIIYSENFFNSPCALEEERLIFDESRERPIQVFPILYNMKFSQMPPVYQNKLENLIYNEIDDSSGTIDSINQIIAKLLIDKINPSTFDLTPSLDQIDIDTETDVYLNETLNMYKQLDKKNFNARISIMYCITKYIDLNYDTKECDKYLFKILYYLFSYTYLSVEFNHKEIIISELALILILRSIL